MKCVMKIQFRKELEFQILRGGRITFFLDMYSSGTIISNIGNKTRLRKIYPKIKIVNYDY